MKDFLGKVRGWMSCSARLLRTNMLLLFAVALVLGMGLKLGAQQFVTIGYGDYSVEQYKGFDFAQIKEDVQKKQEAEQQKQLEEQQKADPATAGEPTSTVPVGGSC